MFMTMAMSILTWTCLRFIEHFTIESSSRLFLLLIPFVHTKNEKNEINSQHISAEIYWVCFHIENRYLNDWQYNSLFITWFGQHLRPPFNAQYTEAIHILFASSQFENHLTKKDWCPIWLWLKTPNDIPSSYRKHLYWRV